MNNKKYSTIKQFVGLLVDNYLNGLIITGEGGLGKSYSVLEAVKERGLAENDYAYINSYSTPLALYNYIYGSKDKKLIIIDDAEGFLCEKKGVGILKALLWSVTGTRKVNYLTTSLDASVLEFELKANIVLLMNKLPEDIHFKALASRCVVYELKLNFAEIIEIMKQLSQNLIISQETYDFIVKNTDESTKGLSIRTAIQINKILGSNQENKETLAMELVKVDEKKKLIVELLRKYNNNKAMAMQEFRTTSQLGRATFYRLCKEYSL